MSTALEADALTTRPFEQLIDLLYEWKYMIADRGNQRILQNCGEATIVENVVLNYTCAPFVVDSRD